MTSLTKILLGFLVFFFVYNPLIAQITNTDCIGATPICANIYEENIVPNDEGLFPNEVNPQFNCGGAGEIKNIWYTFTVNKTGQFGFLIQPNDPLADYDWALYNLTRASCRDIFSDRSLVESCNAAGSSDETCNGNTGATGDTSFSIQGGGCGAATPDLDFGRNPFNDLIDVQAGNTYVLSVSNWSQRSGGYTIDFSLSGDIGIIDNVNPSIANLNVASDCIVSEVEIQFSENIQCSTISLENVSLDGVSGAISSINSEICEQGGFSDSRFNIQFVDPVSISGSYEVMIIPTSQNPVHDLCDNSTGDVSENFMVINDEPRPSLVDVIPDDPCQINSVTINFSQPLLCSGITTNSFTVSGPNGFISGATRLDNCVSSSSFVFELDAPIIDNEEYQLFLNRIPGFDFVNECLKDLDGNIMAIFSKESQDGAAIENVGWNDQCAISELQISFSESIICNTINNDNLNILFQGNVLEGTIVDSNCDNGSPMTLTELTFQLDNAISDNGMYDVQLITNGIDEVLTVCGAPSLSGSKEIMVDLALASPQITDITFPDSCNIQTMSLMFSKEVNCATAQAAGINFRYGNQDVSVSPMRNNCMTSQIIEFDLGSVINSDGDYSFDLIESPNAFTDNCGTPAESNSLAGSLTFDNCDSCFIYVPNAFTPNGDAVNDGIGPLSNCDFGSVYMLVFDRWGNLVFETRGNDVNWDGLFNGSTISRGVYAYIIEIELREFRRSTFRTRKGTFTVM